MKEIFFIIIAILAGGATFALIFKKFGGDCIP